MVGTLIAARQPKRLSFGVHVVGMGVILLLFTIFIANIYLFTVASSIYLLGIGMVVPLSQAKAILAIPKLASHGFGFMYFCMMSGGAVCGLYINKNALFAHSFIYSMIALGALAYLLFFLKIRISEDAEAKRVKAEV